MLTTGKPRRLTPENGPESGIPSRAPAWTGVDSFRDYVMNNSGYGLCAQTDVPWNSGDIGDVILMSTAGNYHHAVIITQVVQDESSGTVD